MQSGTASAGERHLDILMQQLDPGTERYRILETARQFKSSWVALGEELQRVRRRELFAEWGYTSFEEYCQREIRIRRQTADKLTHAYGFLERHAPAMLQQPAAAPLPDYRAVDLLRRATEEGRFDEQELAELRSAVLEQQRPLPAVRNRFNDMARRREEDLDTLKRTLQAALSAVHRLQNALQPLPEQQRAMTDPLTTLATDLERQLAELRGD